MAYFLVRLDYYCFLHIVAHHFLSRYFSDNDCEKPVQGFSVLNGYCLSGDQKTSYRFDNPKENFYFNSGNCTGAVESIDTSSWMNVCFPLSPPVGLAN